MTGEVSKMDAVQFLEADSTQRSKISASLTKKLCLELLHMVAEEADVRQSAWRSELDEVQAASYREKAAIRTEYEEEIARLGERAGEIEEEVRRLSQENEDLSDSLTKAIHARNMYAELVTATKNACQADTDMAMTLYIVTSD